MHIVYTTVEFVSEKKACGGLGHYLANIAEIMASHGHQVTILVSTDHTRKYEWKKNIIVKTYRTERSELATYYASFAKYFIKDKNMDYLFQGSATTNKEIKELHKEHPIDVIQYCGNDISVWFRPRNIACVIRLSSFTPQFIEALKPTFDPFDESWAKTNYSKLFYYSFKKADLVYGPSKVVASIVTSNARQKVQIIESPCVVDCERKYDLSLPELKNKKYLLFFGTLNRLKGIRVIEDAIHTILKENKDIYFVMAGREGEGGSARAVTEAAGEYANRVMYLGEIKEPEALYGIVQHAYACVLPSLIDNLPNTCIEAMGMGKVVIGTHGASYEQLIRNKQNGLLCKRNSPVALVKAVRYLFSLTKEEKADMESKAIQRIKKMAPDVIYEQVIDLYQRAIKKNKSIVRF